MKKQNFLTKWFYGIRHDFDLENPIKDEVKVTHEFKLSLKKQEYIMHETGFVCKNCGKTLWLDRDMMDDLPIPMKYGCTKK